MQQAEYNGILLICLLTIAGYLYGFLFSERRRAGSLE